MSRPETAKQRNAETVRDQWRQLLSLIAKRIARVLMAEQQGSPKSAPRITQRK